MGILKRRCAQLVTVSPCLLSAESDSSEVTMVKRVTAWELMRVRRLLERRWKFVEIARGAGAVGVDGAADRE